MNVKQAIRTFIDYQKLNAGKKYGQWSSVNTGIIQQNTSCHSSHGV